MREEEEVLEDLEVSHPGGVVCFVDGFISLFC